MKFPATKLTRAAALALAAGLVAGCASEEDEVGPAAGAPPASPSAGTGTAAAPAQAVAITDEARKEADQVFASRCVTCHGEAGHGDGPGAANLDPKPRNYTDKAWQETVTDESIEKTIVYGGAAVGKSPQMVPNPDLAAKPVVVAALREKIRNFVNHPDAAAEAPRSDAAAAPEAK